MIEVIYLLFHKEFSYFTFETTGKVVCENFFNELHTGPRVPFTIVMCKSRVVSSMRRCCDYDSKSFVKLLGLISDSWMLVSLVVDHVLSI